MCDLLVHVHMGRYDRAEVVLTLFRSIGFQSYAVESQIQPGNKRIGNVSCRIPLLTQVLLHLCIRLDRFKLLIRQLRPQSNI